MVALPRGRDNTSDYMDYGVPPPRRRDDTSDYIYYGVPPRAGGMTHLIIYITVCLLDR